MKQRSLRLTIAFRFALIVLAVIALVSIASNILINCRFESYVEEQQRSKADSIARNISGQYGTGEDGWNIDYIHGLGMYALNDGFILTLYDRDGNVLWDAEDHDMALCREIMETISACMRENRPGWEGDFATYRYELESAGALVGYLDVGYYSSCCMDENDFQFLAALNRILMAVGVVSLAGAVLMGVLLANSIVKPITRTVEITRKISDGDYGTRLQEDVRTRELRELTCAVNQMAGALEEQEELRKRLTSDVTHELRTPVANLSSYVEMMIDGTLEPSPERLRSCYNELQRLSGLISDLERLRRVEQENLVLHRSDVDLRELALAVMGNFESQLKEKDLDGQVRGDACVVPADRERMQQVMTNLVSNAVKYSAAGGCIRVTVEDRGDSGVIRVEDQGIGIPAEDLKRIFERFYRTDKSRTRKTGGAGIGLTIVKAIVQAHRGTVTAESEAGKGSVFTVTLPKDDPTH